MGFVPGGTSRPRWRIYRDPLHANIIWGVAATLGVVFIVFIWEFARDAYLAVAGSDKMASCLKRLGIGTIGALSIFGTQLATISSADARHLRGGHRHNVYWAGYKTIGGFELGAGTYTYCGYRHYEKVVVYPSDPVIRARY